ncbi:hypothetical protein CMEL01_05383 [Colletotrichum melonis]|uniref:Uncharacterized protein n=1 Tax=Colletotrichum melonis TaxID=1209925 RepID=A0AAI9U8I4_9PEZI|nr:hypothetical protein CMEL01_05383 [Colletotrichum melonis]
MSVEEVPRSAVKYHFPRKLARLRLKLREGWKKCLSSHHYHRPPSATDGPLELAPALACRRKSDPPSYHRSSSAPVLLLYTVRPHEHQREVS